MERPHPSRRNRNRISRRKAGKRAPHPRTRRTEANRRTGDSVRVRRRRSQRHSRHRHRRRAPAHPTRPSRRPRTRCQGTTSKRSRATLDTSSEATARTLVAVVGWLFGVSPPQWLTRVLRAFVRPSGFNRVLVMGSVLWVLLYAGWTAGHIGPQASIWLSAGVVLTARYALYLGSSRSPAVRSRHPSDAPERARAGPSASRHGFRVEQVGWRGSRR